MTNGEAINEFLGCAGRDNSALALNWRNIGKIDSGGGPGIGEAADNDS